MSRDMMTITGLEETSRALKNLPKIVAARGYLRALSRGIGVMRYELDIRTPVRKSEIQTVGQKGESHPGDLKRALTTDIQLDSQFRGGTADVGFAGFQGKIAFWNEYGHRIVVRGGSYHDSRGRKRKGTVKSFIAADPFIRRTFDACADEVVEVVAESLTQTVEGL